MKNVVSRSLAGLCLALTLSSTAALAQESAETARSTCTLAKLKGHWGYSEHGALTKGVPYPGAAFGEVGWLKLDDDGTGEGLAFLSINGTPIPDPREPGGLQGIPLIVTSVKLNARSCTGFATFYTGAIAEPNKRTITFVVAANFTEFYYISTTGDLTAVGTAKRQR